MRKFFLLLCWLTVLAAIAGFGMLLSVFPRHPQTFKGWVWLFVLALPITLLGEFLGDRLWKNRLAQTIEQRTANQTLSLLRIAYGLAVMLFVLVAAFSLGVFLALKVD